MTTQIVYTITTSNEKELRQVLAEIENIIGLVPTSTKTIENEKE